MLETDQLFLCLEQVSRTVFKRREGGEVSLAYVEVEELYWVLTLGLGQAHPLNKHRHPLRYS